MTDGGHNGPKMGMEDVLDCAKNDLKSVLGP